jgi:pilus assembly protein CpaE
MSDHDGNRQITILLVDDIPETRENIKKLLAFEPDMKVIGAAGTGKEGVELTKELRPDIIIMDINMPDMDGLQATGIINKAVPTAAVIIMSVQDDNDYMRRAMLAGARDFLVKPISMDDLYNTIRTVYRNHEPIRRQYEMNQLVTPAEALKKNFGEGAGSRAGHIIVVYSPQGGAGTTTVATNLASGLMKDGVKVLLVDGDLQFGDIDTFLNLQATTTVVDLLEDVDDFDVDHFDNIVMTHESGLKVLLGPTRPEFADEVKTRPGAVAEILRKVSGNYDFVIVDTSCNFDEFTLSLFDAATRIVLLTTPSLSGVKNVRFVLDLFDKLQYPPDKAMLVLNKVWDERQRKQATLAPEKIEGFLKRKIEGEIPHVDERIILSAILRGVPVIAAERDTNKPPVKQMLDLAQSIYHKMMGEQEAPFEEVDRKKKGSRLPFGR